MLTLDKNARLRDSNLFDSSTGGNNCAQSPTTHLYSPQDDARSDRSDSGDEERNGDLDGRLPPFLRLDAGELVLLALVVPAPVATRGIPAYSRF